MTGMQACPDRHGAQHPCGLVAHPGFNDSRAEVDETDVDLNACGNGDNFRRKQTKRRSLGLFESDRRKRRHYVLIVPGGSVVLSNADAQNPTPTDQGVLHFVIDHGRV